MKKLSTIFISSLFATAVFAQNPTYEWAGSFGADSTDGGGAITTDALGNVYNAGSCIGAIDFDINAGVYSLGPAAGNNNEQDIFITKSDASGNLIWAKRIGDTTTVFGNNNFRNGAQSIKVDTAGNVYVLGFYRGIIDFDPGPGVVLLNSMALGSGVWQTYILKLDASGNFIWVKELAASTYCWGTSMALDATANVFITGYYIGIVDLDPSPATFTFVSGSSNAYIVKLDASGNFLMGKHLATTTSNGSVYGASIALDLTGNVYTTGIFNGSVDFDPGTNSYILGSGSNLIGRNFILKLDALGSFLWVKEYGNDYSRVVLEVDDSNLYITGTFRDTADFDPGPSIYNLIATGNNGFQTVNYDQFILKLDLNGNFVWAKSIASTGTSYGVDIALDAVSNVYVSGFFEGGADLDPGSGVNYVTSNGGVDGYILKIDASGNFVWGRTLGGTEDDIVGELAISNGSDIHATGNFGSSVDADPGNSIVNLTSLGKNDAFILKWSQCSAATSPIDITSPQNKLICENTSASLSATSNNQIAWYSTPTGSMLSLGTGSNYFSPPLVTGSYIFYAGDKECESISRTAITVSVNACTGLNEITSNSAYKIDLYPVPSTDGFVSLIVKQFSEDLSLKVYNTIGELIIHQKIVSDKTDLDLSSLPQGIYLAEISKVDKLWEVKKIIKQ